ncbi:MAG: short-chain dehydrogenase [Mycobacterium sp.]|nr:short-chain dehydrogenase [Mycobacterium sp.]
MTGPLNGTVALVTGASSGIGEATARALAAEGAMVAVAARRKERLDALAASIDGRVLAIEADITDRAQAESAIERTVGELGRLDTLVNNAALPHLLRAAEDSPRGVADVVNISSTSGRVISPMAAVYNLTKFGIGAFSEALRQEVTRRHVRVSLVEPGGTATELATHNRDEILVRPTEQEE